MKRKEAVASLTSYLRGERLLDTLGLSEYLHLDTEDLENNELVLLAQADYGAKAYLLAMLEKGNEITDRELWELLHCCDFSLNSLRALLYDEDDQPTESATLAALLTCIYSHDVQQDIRSYLGTQIAAKDWILDTGGEYFASWADFLEMYHLGDLKTPIKKEGFTSYRLNEADPEIMNDYLYELRTRLEVLEDMPMKRQKAATALAMLMQTQDEITEDHLKIIRQGLPGLDELDIHLICHYAQDLQARRELYNFMRTPFIHAKPFAETKIHDLVGVSYVGLIDLQACMLTFPPNRAAGAVIATIEEDIELFEEIGSLLVEEAITSRKFVTTYTGVYKHVVDKLGLAGKATIYYRENGEPYRFDDRDVDTLYLDNWLTNFDTKGR